MIWVRSWSHKLSSFQWEPSFRKRPQQGQRPWGMLTCFSSSEKMLVGSYVQGRRWKPCDERSLDYETSQDALSSFWVAAERLSLFSLQQSTALRWGRCWGGGVMSIFFLWTALFSLQQSKALSWGRWWRVGGWVMSISFLWTLIYSQNST